LFVIQKLQIILDNRIQTQKNPYFSRFIFHIEFIFLENKLMKKKENEYRRAEKEEKRQKMEKRKKYKKEAKK